MIPLQSQHNEDQRKTFLICSILAALVPFFITTLPLQLVSTFYPKYTRHVDKKKCTCSCWDTVFKGRYEMGVAGYKNVYFNSTYNTYMMWALTLIFLFALYESLKHIFHCLLNKCARKKIVLIFFTSIYPNYYGWWMYFNYYNDDFYDQWWHQTLFTLTELVSTMAILMLVNENNSTSVPRKLLVIQSIAVLHVIASSGDQFVSNVLLMRGSGFQVSFHHIPKDLLKTITYLQVMRDIAFMIPDLLNIVIPLFELKRQANKRRLSSIWEVLHRNDLFIAAASIIVLWLTLLSLP